MRHHALFLSLSFDFRQLSETAKSLLLRITSACQCDSALIGAVLFPALVCPSALQLARDAALDRADGDEDEAVKFDDASVGMPDSFLDASSDDADQDEDESFSSASSPAVGASARATTSASERRPHFAASGPLVSHRNAAPHQLLLPLMPLPSWPKGKAAGALPPFSPPPRDAFHSARVALAFESARAQWRPLLSLLGRALPSFFPRFLHAVVGELRRRTAAVAAAADIAMDDAHRASTCGSDLPLRLRIDDDFHLLIS
jgi:hypothetical protein